MKLPRCPAAFAACAALLFAHPSHAQWSASNLLVAQSGNVPFADPANRTSFYDQFRLDCATRDASAGIRYESHRNSEDRNGYAVLTQRWVEWRDAGFRARAGNFYTILGRGLLHRSFELPGVVLENPGDRSPYGPSRDLDGVLLEASQGRFRARAFSGRPNGGELSPGLETGGQSRYAPTMSGAEVSALLGRGARAGIAYARSPQGNNGEFGTGFAELDPLRALKVKGASLPVYFEYAQRGGVRDWLKLRTDSDTPHALYAGLNFLSGGFALSAEWKDYAQFRFGTNDPPSLVKEHPEALLNRNTHILDANDEQGYQLEASYTLPELGTAAVNLSRGDRSNAGRPQRFVERYLELRTAPLRESRRFEARVFGSTGQDPYLGNLDRTLYGAAGTWQWNPSWSVTLDLEGQRATRPGGQSPYEYSDAYLACTFSRAEIGSAGLVWERTTDKADRPPAVPGDPPFRSRNFLGLYLSGRISSRQEATLFCGERRGGRACTAGTCYEVLPFKGAELRLTSRL